ncbi:ATP-binding protein [Streptomyces sp. NPDC093223]|uniref:ATP-binding protein n=1 Tax=Streptomyces sp. NPDC093223 TaxID=3366033 RepID=UPI0038064452
MPSHAPTVTAAGAAFLAWLRTPRPEAAVGIWRAGHQPRPEQEPERTPGRRLVGGALLSGLLAWLVWSLLYDGYLGLWWLVPLDLLAPDDWVHGRSGPGLLRVTYYGYYALVVAVLVAAAARAGRWAEVWRRYAAARLTAASPAKAALLLPGEDPALWPHLRAAGAAAAADRLTTDAVAGLMGDVDHARITQAWTAVRAGHRTLEDFVRAVLRDGAAACGHPSGARDLPGRSAPHDLVTHQVRIGTAADTDRNPWAYRAAGVAVGPDTVGTSLLVVGPAGPNGTGRIVRPVTEAMGVQALAGRAAVVVVGTAADHGPPCAYDVVVRLGDPASPHALNLYGGITDPDEAAAVLAEALTGDLAHDRDAGAQRTAAVLRQLLGPFAAAYGRLPVLDELRQLLDGTPGRLPEVRRLLEAAGHTGMMRDLDARVRQSSMPGDAAMLLADRLALLDRPAFSNSLAATGGYCLRDVDRPVRVRIELPTRGHADVPRVLARLVLAQYLAAVTHRANRSLLACLVLDDAPGTITTAAVHGIQRLRTAHACTVLALRTLDDVTPALRAPLLGAIGCRVATAGLTAADGRHFADAWGTAWTETRAVTDRQIIAETAAGRALHLVRQAVTGTAPTARAVTVQQVERDRWSASDLAHTLPAGHAVISLTDTAGHRTPPLLVDLQH